MVAIARPPEDRQEFLALVGRVRFAWRTARNVNTSQFWSALVVGAMQLGFRCAAGSREHRLVLAVWRAAIKRADQCWERERVRVRIAQ